MSSLDKLTIDTPEQIALELLLAGIGSRFFAFVYDSLMQVIVFVILSLGLAFVPPALFRWLPQSLAPALLLLAYFCLYWGYFAAFEIFWKGQTPGKRQAGIRVIKDTGRPANTFEVIGRNLMRVIDGFPGLYAVAIITMMLNKQNRRLGDYVAGTVVVHDKPAKQMQASLSSNPEAAAPIPGDARIAPEELVLIETFLTRRDELPEDVRRLKAMQIATRISSRLQISIPPGQGTEEFLEALARKARDEARFAYSRDSNR